MGKHRKSKFKILKRAKADIQIVTEELQDKLFEFFFIANEK